MSEIKPKGVSPMPRVRRMSIVLGYSYMLIMLLTFVMMLMTDVKVHNVAVDYTVAGKWPFGRVFLAVNCLMLTLSLGSFALAFCCLPDDAFEGPEPWQTLTLWGVLKYIACVFLATPILAIYAAGLLVPAVPILLFGKTEVILVTVEKTGGAGYRPGQCASGAIFRWPTGKTEKSCLPLGFYAKLADGEILEQPYRRWRDLVMVSPVRQRESPQD